MTDRAHVPVEKTILQDRRISIPAKLLVAELRAEAERDTETRFTLEDALRAGVSLDLVPSVTRRALKELVHYGHADWHGGELVFRGPEGVVER
jgi:hypothetical protein